MSKRRKSPSRNPKIQCSDCAKTAPIPLMGHAGITSHHETCPTYRAIMAVTDADRIWFEAHPGASYRCRPITPAERKHMADIHRVESIPKEAIIRVQQLEPGIRFRKCYVPGVELEDDFIVPAGVIGLFGHPETFDLLENQMGGKWPRSSVAVLDGEMQVRLFPLPGGKKKLSSHIPLKGLAVLPSGSRFPVPFERPVAIDLITGRSFDLPLDD